eukprot:TRINITY_DN16481_c0_g1_i1.p1 TRINITY_DN16481_c0_g1~~TRINITY_DN16481_c0_g1_i1.p1  ORF type:complete len:1025 (-),score=48.85 TRINITY_DN16481_c0_g1_i1:343-3417(-)
MECFWLVRWRTARKTGGGMDLRQALPVATALAASVGVWSSEAACLPNAIDATSRVPVDHETMSLGLWVAEWESSVVASNVFRILAEEILGYEVVLGPPGGGISSLAAIWALAGCEANQDCLHNASRWALVRSYHIALDVYPFAVLEHKKWEQLMPERAPVRILDIGYAGYESTFIHGSLFAGGPRDDGIPLQVFNESLHDLVPSFHKVQDIDAGLLGPCDSSSIRQAITELHFERYVDTFPDDTEGYYRDLDGVHRPECFNGNWWLSPSCRQDPDKCIPWITYRAWKATVHMQRATAYNLPLAIGFANSMTAYELIPRRYKVLVYWWSPDSTFLDLGMESILFPQNEHRRFQTAPADQGHLPELLDKYVMNGLQARAPLLLAQRLRIKPDAMDAMMRELSAGKDAYTAACDWLKSETGKSDDTWKAWIPNATDCVKGQGWADDDERPVRNLTDATRCMWCGVGSVSQYDPEARGYLCTSCPAGTFFVLLGNGACQHCGVGRFTDTAGQTSCERCESGSYSSKLGSSNCTACPAGLITTGEGANSSSACVCERGLYHSVGNDATTICRSCGWLQTTPSAGARSADDCRTDWELVKQAALLLFILGCSCAGLVPAAFFRRYKGLLQDESMHKAVKQGLRSISALRHPMCVMPLICFTDLTESELSACHEGARDRGSLLVLDTAADVQRFQESGRKVLFFSYTWTNWSKLGPNDVQLSCMKAAARRIQSRTGIDPEHLYIWIDILSIPQSSDSCKELAVDSLYVYASKADYLVVICPENIHAQTGEAVGMETYKSRLWCRVEQMAYFSSHGLGAMWYSMYPGELVAIDESWLRDVVHICDGQVTCCRLGHPQKRPCDRQLLVPTVLAMYTYLLRRVISGAPGDIQNIWNLMNVERDRTFPRSFSYDDSGHLYKRELFGSTVDRIYKVTTGSGASVAGSGRKLRRGDSLSDISWVGRAGNVLSSKLRRQHAEHIADWLMQAVDESNQAALHYGRSAADFRTRVQLERARRPAVLDAHSWAHPSTVVSI